MRTPRRPEQRDHLGDEDPHDGAGDGGKDHREYVRAGAQALRVGEIAGADGGCDQRARRDGRADTDRQQQEQHRRGVADRGNDIDIAEHAEEQDVGEFADKNCHQPDGRGAGHAQDVSGYGAGHEPGRAIVRHGNRDLYNVRRARMAAESVPSSR